MEDKRTIQDLRMMQAAPLSVKVRMTQRRIREWVDAFGTDGVYVSFSGGKDSTVLLHIVREMYPNVPAVFCDTGLEYPEIRDFVKMFDNVVWLKPKMTFRQVIEKYGYPFISKEVSDKVHRARINRAGNAWKAFHGLKSGTRYDLTRWAYLIEAPFEIDNRCCDVMKKGIAKAYEKQTGRKAITGQMADESMLRTANWLQHGCNAFESKRKMSNPISFWLENDVLQYIKEKCVDYCHVYGDIVEDNELPGQIDWSEYAGFDIGGRRLTTTGKKRTGCMFCGYGCHLEKPGDGRFETMKTTHPKQYAYIMKPWDEGGLGYKDVIDWLNEHGNLNIRY